MVLEVFISLLMTKMFTAGPSTINIAKQTELCCRALWQSSYGNNIRDLNLPPPPPIGALPNFTLDALSSVIYTLYDVDDVLDETGSVISRVHAIFTSS